MGIFSKSRAGGFMDEIRCDEQSYLIWKWHPTGARRGENNRENAIRWGSSLRVKEGSIAVFVHSDAHGIIQDFIEGPFDKILETDNLPILASVLGLAYAGGTPFQAEIYFINLAKIIQIKFAVPFFDVYDPRFLDFGVPVAVRGTLTFQISDYREFIKLHSLNHFSIDDFQTQIKDVVISQIKNIVSNAPLEYNIPVIQLERKIDQISEKVKPILEKRLREDFAISVSGIDISAIDVDKRSDGYLQLKGVTQDVSTATIKAQSDANVKNIHDMQRINAENIEETMRIQREEAQYAQRKATQTTHFAAYQVETQRDVGVAGAQALGHSGTPGSNGIPGDGNSLASMVAGMSIGGAMGQNIAGLINNTMAGTVQTPSPGTVPPPIPVSAYHVVVNGQATGPHNLTILAQMISSGSFMRSSLVWKQGMATWAAAETVQELQELFENTSSVPPIP